MLKQYDFVNEIENCQDIIVLAYLIVQQVDPTSKHVH